MLEIDGRYKGMMRQDRTRVEQWVSTATQNHSKTLFFYFYQTLKKIKDFLLEDSIQLLQKSRKSPICISLGL